MKKNYLFVLFIILTSLNVSAHDIEFMNPDGKTIFYNFINDGKELEVTYRGGSSYAYTNRYDGKIAIPEEITYNETIYRVTSIGEFAFFCCGTTSITIPASITKIDGNAFNGCNNLKGVYINDLSAWCKINAKGDTSNPLIQAHHLYLNGEELKELVIPNNVTSIGNNAFNGCSALISVTIPNSVTSIGYGAFNGCNNLTSITIPASVTSIGKNAFSGCRGLNSVYIPDFSSWLNISMNGKNDLFSYVDHLYINGIEVKDMIVPDGILSIVDYAFSGCNSLTSLYLPNSVISIGVSAYDSCNGLTSITIPNSVTTIGNEAFANCLNLTSLTIPNSVTSIGDGAFQNCSRLTSLTIGEGVTEIGPSAFSGCASLTSVDIPDNIKNIGTYAFYGCKGLATVNMGNSVMDIGYGAFCGCGNLTSLEIPNSVTNISWNAFKDCPNIISVKVHWKRPLAGGADSFLEDVKKNATLYVPKGTAMMYMSAPGWIEFENIVEFEEETSISQPEIASELNADWYTLDGRKLEGEPTEKGVYIVNGKKVYVK